MNRLTGFLVCTGFLAIGSLAIAQEEYDSAAYATCAACHLPDGAGIPGAFPPIRNRAAKMAALEGGREYLVTVVTYGLMGTIEVDGAQYFGVMAGNAGPMSPADIADAINYIVFELDDDDTADTKPFTAEEVETIQAAITMKSPAGGGQLRTELAGKHGDEWP